MKKYNRLWLLIALASLHVTWTGCAGKSKGAKLATNLLKGTQFESLSPDIEFTSFSPVGSAATAEGKVATGFRFHKENNRWVLKEVRLAEMEWESVQDLQEALDAVRARRTQREMRAILEAIEKYNRQKETYPSASSFVDLIDRLSPDYLDHVIRFDAWQHEYRMRMDRGRPTIISNGPDGKEDTADDIGMP